MTGRSRAVQYFDACSNRPCSTIIQLSPASGIRNMFYRRFFELAPETRSLFPNDLERQYLTLMDMMAAIIGALDRQELFQSITTYAGLRHARFGAKPAYFSAFGDALIWSLSSTLARLLLLS